MAKFDRIRDNLAFGVSVDKFEAAVRLQGWTNVEAILGTKVPRPARCWLSMDEDPTTNWPKWHLVEVKGPLKKIPRTDLRVESGLSEEIEGKFCKWRALPNCRDACLEGQVERWHST
jgi:hypothetical protein